MTLILGDPQLAVRQQPIFAWGAAPWGNQVAFGHRAGCESLSTQIRVDAGWPGVTEYVEDT
jgi:hypothetical protein